MASAAQGSLADALNQAFAIETPFYSVVAEHDGRGRATLALPAAGPDSRVAVVIDNEYLALLDLQPTDGMLRINTLIAPKTLPDAPAPGIARDGTIHYVVLRPKPGSAASPAETHNLLGLNLAPRRAYAADVYRECLEWTTNTRCRTNGRVYVMWRLTVPLPTADADAIISQVDVLWCRRSARRQQVTLIIPGGSPCALVQTGGRAPFSLLQIVLQSRCVSTDQEGLCVTACNLHSLRRTAEPTRGEVLHPLREITGYTSTRCPCINRSFFRRSWLHS
ncbi:hypothetical protein [Roseiflexus castenholzii]|uniref:hypothetical protein n=1 Tax=Roseiflexus castenholzii TaxID=120962 RepID=UPI002352C866